MDTKERSKSTTLLMDLIEKELFDRSSFQEIMNDIQIETENIGKNI